MANSSYPSENPGVTPEYPLTGCEQAEEASNYILCLILTITKNYNFLIFRLGLLKYIFKIIVEAKVHIKSLALIESPLT